MDDELGSAWLRGLLEPCLLALLVEGEAYGYQLAGRLDDAGLGSVAGGSLYPALVRLEEKGWVTSQWRAGDGGPGRKYYQLTVSGRDRLDQVRARWGPFAASVTGVLTAAEPGTRQRKGRS